jgi:elongation factor P
VTPRAGRYALLPVAFSSNDLKNGMTLELAEGLFQVVEFQHVKPGKGGAFVRTKLRNVRSGAVVDRTFRGGEPLTQAIVEKNEMQLLYQDGDGYVFMDSNTYDQVVAPKKSLGDAAKFMKDNDTVQLTFFGDEIIGVELPAAVDLAVKETEPGIQGDRVSGAKKPAILETGISVQVPLFVNIGDVVRVDTRSGDYMTRV